MACCLNYREKNEQLRRELAVEQSRLREVEEKHRRELHALREMLRPHSDCRHPPLGRETGDAPSDMMGENQQLRRHLQVEKITSGQHDDMLSENQLLRRHLQVEKNRTTELEIQLEEVKQRSAHVKNKMEDHGNNDLATFAAMEKLCLETSDVCTQTSHSKERGERPSRHLLEENSADVDSELQTDRIQQDPENKTQELDGEAASAPQKIQPIVVRVRRRNVKGEEAKEAKEEEEEEQEEQEEQEQEEQEEQENQGSASLDSENVASESQESDNQDWESIESELVGGRNAILEFKLEEARVERTELQIRVTELKKTLLNLQEEWLEVRSHLKKAKAELREEVKKNVVLRIQNQHLRLSAGQKFKCEAAAPFTSPDKDAQAEEHERTWWQRFKRIFSCGTHKSSDKEGEDTCCPNHARDTPPSETSSNEETLSAAEETPDKGGGIKSDADQTGSSEHNHHDERVDPRLLPSCECLPAQCRDDHFSEPET